jgi:hypothetical protein
MGRHHQNGAGRMSHYLLRDAPDQDMFETSESMRRRDDQIDIVIFCEGADINDR